MNSICTSRSIKKALFWHSFLFGACVVVVTLVVMFFLDLHYAPSLRSVAKKGQQNTAKVSQNGQETSMIQIVQGSPPNIPPPPLLVAHGLFVAGYDARQSVMTDTNHTYYWKWAEDTDVAFKEIYDKAMTPLSCNDTAPVIVVLKPVWGLGSRIRDAGDVMFKALDSETPLIHDGPTICPGPEENDPFMLCQFELFSSCQGVLSTRQRGAAYYDRFDPKRLEKSFDHWWELMRKHGLHALTVNGTLVPDPMPPNRDEKLAVLRTLLVRQTFYKPSKHVLTRVEELEKHLEPAYPMLTVHLRRTDKVQDKGKMYRHEKKAGFKETLIVVNKLLQAAERLSGLTFRSIFLMSDDPRLFSTEATNYLSRHMLSPTKPKVIFNDFVAAYLSNNTKYLEEGHHSLGVKEHAMMDIQLIADIQFASKHSSYLVGNGKSGVSQLIAQLLGARYHMCPSTLSLFEDDPILLEYLPETTEWAWLLEM